MEVSQLTEFNLKELRICMKGVFRIQRRFFDVNGKTNDPKENIESRVRQWKRVNGKRRSGKFIRHGKINYLLN